MKTRPVRERFDEKYFVEPNTGCWLWTATVSSVGYASFYLNGEPRGAHRVAWEWRHGTIPPGMWVLHSCDTRSCVNPDHLFLGTPQDNTQDMIRKGRDVRGEQHPTSKLTTSQVDAIRQRLADGDLQSIVATEFGVARTTVSAIAIGRSWNGRL